MLAYNGKSVVDRSDFTIPRRRLTAVIGPNGSGKSSLLNALTGLLKLAGGRIEVFGVAPAHAHERVAYVLQAATVNQVMPLTVRDVVAMGRYGSKPLFRRLGGEDRALCRQAIERLGIANLQSRLLLDLSGGQRQRVFVAQGLAQDADMLLLDEPLTGLDLASREGITRAISDELERGRTVVLTTHDLAEAAAADHVILMTGRVVAEGPPEEVLKPDRLSAAYGIGLVHLEDGTAVLDDATHDHRPRHIHFERSESRRD